MLIGLGLFFVFGVVSFALLFSSIFKSPLVSVIVTTLVLWFVMPAISGVLQFVNIEPWFLLNYSGNAIQNLAAKQYPSHYQQIPVPTGMSNITLHIYNPTVPEAAAIIAAYAIISIIAGIIIYTRRELKEI
jgi:ABC-type transport system involved in multi-copper enzyme maturation permease subunit